MPSLWDRMYGAYRGFREPAMYPEIRQQGRGAGFLAIGADWGAFETRNIRHSNLWALAQQQAYRDILGTEAGRADYGLNNAIRDLFGVAFQLSEFHTAHLQGGDLDPEAGDGREPPSALPIVMEAEDPAVREALAEAWKRSNWQIYKDVMCRFGATVGDAFVGVCDDADAETIRLGVVIPTRVEWCDTSGEGNVEAFQLDYLRPDPRRKPAAEQLDAPRLPMVRYTELVTPDPSGGYRFRTYLDRNLFVWPGNPSSDFVIEDLPFAPLVKIQHKNIGLGWGQAEAHQACSHAREAADLSSCLTDWGRRALNADFLIAGAKSPDDPANKARATGQARGRETYETQPGLNQQAGYENATRTNQNFLFISNENARAQSLVHDLPVDGLGAQIDRIRAKMTDDYPELSFERIRVSGDASAEAIREARKPAEAKISSRRVEYDAGSARAFRMALDWGGRRGYRHYEGLGQSSYDDGRLDFRIGARPAFAPDPTEEIAERQARYTSLKAAADAGLPLDLAMREAGYSDADIASAVKAKADAQAQALELARTKGPPKAVDPGDAT